MSMGTYSTTSALLCSPTPTQASGSRRFIANLDIARSLREPQYQNTPLRLPTTRRRDLLLGTAAPLLGLGLGGLGFPTNSEAIDAVVGSYLPPSPSNPSFVFFKSSAKDTPALRAGIDPLRPCHTRSLLNLAICRKCATIRVYSTAVMETDKSRQHTVGQLLPAKVRRAMGGGEIRRRQAR